ncbi:uncharacterized protein [Paramormyrops kingsleyae]|uniref:uncharacterized protein n=1 Tax=Paramormyrops kingsleyae TaxID=1676925 RepID=UPI003B9714F3
MSQQNYMTDTQSVLLSMLARMKINSAEATQSQQPQKQQCTFPTGGNLGKYGPVLTACATNTGEQSPVTSGDVTKSVEHTKQWAHGGRSNRDLSLKFEVPSLDCSRKSAFTNQDENSAVIIPKWKRIQMFPCSEAPDHIPPMRDAENEMTPTAICTPAIRERESLCMEIAGSQEVTNQTYPPQWDINQQKKHGDQSSGVLRDTVRVGGPSPLAASYPGGAGTLNFAELKGTGGKGHLIPTQNVIRQKQQSMDVTVHNTSTGSTSLNPEKYSENYLASDPDLWNKIKWDRSVRNARDDNFTSAPEFWKLDTVPTHDSGTGKKKRKWINGKTLRWAQKIRQSWKERQVTVKEGEQGASCQVREGKTDDQVAQNVKHPVQGSSRADIFNDIHVGREETICQKDLSGQVNMSIPNQEPAAFGRGLNDFQFNFSPINFADEIFASEHWSKFSSHEERLSSMKASSPSDLKMPSWIRENVHNGEMKMTEKQANQSGFRTHDDSPVKKSSTQENTFGVSPLVVPVNDGNGNEVNKAMSEVWSSAPSCFEQDQEESKEAIPSNLSFDVLQPVKVLDNSALMSRVYLNRKRLHLTREQSISNEEEEHLVFRDSTGSPHEGSTSEMQTVESQNQDSDVCSCLETVAKKRKLRDPTEDTRHVHFAEVLVTDIPSLPYYETRDVSLPKWIVAMKKKSRRRNNRSLQDAFHDF